MQNTYCKNVFERQSVLLEAKQQLNSQNMSTQQYNRVQGITAKPEINVKSRSLKRTIDDLYNWQLRKQNKLKAERQKSASPKISPSLTSKTITSPKQPKFSKEMVKIEETDIESSESKNSRVLQQISPNVNYTYPFKLRTGTLHTHYVDTENGSCGRNELLDPVKQTLNMSAGKGWAEMTLLERNQLFINNK